MRDKQLYDSAFVKTLINKSMIDFNELDLIVKATCI